MPQAKEVQQKRATYGQQNVKLEPSTSTDETPLFGCINYQPIKPETEDEESTNRHVASMREAFKARKTVDTDSIETLMGLTLYSRREDILRGATVVEILGKYPWLKKSAMFFLNEFKRITEVEIDSRIEDFLDTYGNSILLMIRSKIKDTDLLMTGLIDNRGSGPNEKYRVACIAILGVPFLFSEARNAIIGQENPGPGPFLQYSCAPDRFIDLTSFTLFVDGVKVVQADDLIEGFACLFASFYVFNIAYPKQIEMSVSLFERLFLKTGAQKQGKAGRRVVSVISALNSVVKGGKKASCKKGAPTKLGKSCK